MRSLLKDGPVPDVHTFLRLAIGDHWMDVDGTWPSRSEELGMTVNHDFQTGVNMKIACDPIEFFEVPDGMDPQAFKEELIEIHCKDQNQQRDQFIEELSGWMASATK